MDTILLVDRDPETRRAWWAALSRLGARVVTTDSLLTAPKIAARERAAVMVAAIDEQSFSELRWIASTTALPPMVLITDAEHLPPLAARSRGAAVVPPGRPETLAEAVGELLAARRQPAMNLPLRLPQVCETKWTARLQTGYEDVVDSDTTWPGDAAA